MRSTTRVLVAGGGPAGSMAAILLAREGVEVTLVEREKFPRYHIGESLLTAAIPVLEFVDLLDRVENHGFVRKLGGFFRVKQGEPAGHIDFTKLSKYKHSYQVVRSEFDQILLEHARASGADVHEETSLTDVEFRDERPVSARWAAADGSEGQIQFDYLVDATGQTGLLSNRYFKNRRAEEAFANVAVGGYWKDALPYKDKDGGVHPGAFSMEALTDGAGWTWAIPLHNGTLSVGIVLHRDAFVERRNTLGSLEPLYDQALKTSPDVTSLLVNATRVDALRVWRDYSYIADCFAGPGYRLAGDAAGFIDPLFSSGVHLAFLGGVSSAATICSEIRGEVDGATAERFHDRCLRHSYTRFIITVGGFYMQLHDQDKITLPGVSSEDFQLAFDIIQPVVSGNIDLNSSEIPPDVLKRTMQYTTDMMLEAHEIKTGNLVARMMSTRMMDDQPTERFGAVDGRVIRLKRGQLGIPRLGALDSVLAGARHRIIRGFVATRRGKAPSGG